MTMTASALRANIYRILDRILETGEPVEIERNGRVLRIIAEDAPSKLDRLVRRDDFIRGDPEEIVEIDWSDLWSPELP